MYMVQETVVFVCKKGQRFEIRSLREDDAKESLDLMVEVAGFSPYILSTPDSFRERTLEGQTKWIKEGAESQSEIILRRHSF
jgi:hypothetical protein